MLVVGDGVDGNFGLTGEELHAPVASYEELAEVVCSLERHNLLFTGELKVVVK